MECSNCRKFIPLASYAILLLTAISRASAQTNCEALSSCKPDSSSLSLAVRSGRHEEACSILLPAHDCVKTAAADCEARGLANAEQISAWNQKVATIEGEIDKLCEPNTGGITCLQAGSCSSHMANIADTVSSGDLRGACKMLTLTFDCLKAAIADCKERGMVTLEAINSMEESYRSTQTQMSQFCPKTTGPPIGVEGGYTIEPETGCFQVTECITDMDSFTDKIVNQAFAEACNVIKQMLTCLNSAITDCQFQGILNGDQLQSMLEGWQTQMKTMKGICPDLPVIDFGQITDNKNEGDSSSISSSGSSSGTRSGEGGSQTNGSKSGPDLSDTKRPGQSGSESGDTDGDSNSAVLPSFGALTHLVSTALFALMYFYCFY